MKRGEVRSRRKEERWRGEKNGKRGGEKGWS